MSIEDGLRFGLGFFLAFYAQMFGLLIGMGLFFFFQAIL